MSYFHQSVLLDEVIHYLKPQPGQKFIDCTLGGGGHTLGILKRTLPGGKVLGIDLDNEAIKATDQKAKELKLKNNLVLVQDNFRNIGRVAKENGFGKVDGILLDLGLSSAQLHNHDRGFSFLSEGGLDMRFGHQTKITASEILNTYPEKRLYEIFKNFGEERLSKPISQKIIEIRRQTPFASSQQLVDLVAAIYKKYYRHDSKVNPATKVFQALRIAVNEELENLEEVLPQAIKLLAKGGRLAVISYHSLEDRTVKNFFQQESKGCICPPKMPVCQCKHKKTLQIITKKPITPTEEEITLNHRSRSAKLRIAEKIN